MDIFLRPLMIHLSSFIIWDHMFLLHQFIPPNYIGMMFAIFVSDLIR